MTDDDNRANRPSLLKLIQCKHALVVKHLAKFEVMPNGCHRSFVSGLFIMQSGSEHLNPLPVPT